MNNPSPLPSVEIGLVALTVTDGRVSSLVMVPVPLAVVIPLVFLALARLTVKVLSGSKSLSPFTVTLIV